MAASSPDRFGVELSRVLGVEDPAAHWSAGGGVRVPTHARIYRQVERSVSGVTNHDVLFGFRLALFDLARRTTVSHACRTFKVTSATSIDSPLDPLDPRQNRPPDGRLGVPSWIPWATHSPGG
jgi:hypothetical protein